MLTPISIPGLFITGTDTGVGKTLIAGAIADWFYRRGKEVAVCKPVATGCVQRREGLVSEDAEFLAHCADTLAPLDVVCPQRYAEPLAPAIAAERAKRPVDWIAIDSAIQSMLRGGGAAKPADVIIIEGVGGLMVPIDRETLLIDVIKQLSLPAVLVARPGLGTINHTLLSLAALRAAGIPIAGIVINRYPPDTADTAIETNPRAIEKWGKAPVLCLVPDVSHALSADLSPDIAAAIDTVDWSALAVGQKNAGT